MEKGPTGMLADSLGLAVNGEVTLEELETSVRGLRSLIGALQNEVAPTVRIRWIVDRLSSGSAIARYRGEPESPDGYAAVDRVVRAYDRVGFALLKGGPLSDAEGAAVSEITSVIGNRIHSIRLETDQGDYEVMAPRHLAPPTPAPVMASLGAIEGRIQTLSNRRGLYFTLYERLSDRPVSCYLSNPEGETMLREHWGKLAIVEGMVRRDPFTGDPTTIRKITAIVALNEGVPGGFRAARGCSPSSGLTASEAIARVRDAS